jgi:hypothetical protein
MSSDVEELAKQLYARGWRAEDVRKHLIGSHDQKKHGSHSRDSHKGIASTSTNDKFSRMSNTKFMRDYNRMKREGDKIDPEFEAEWKRRNKRAYTKAGVAGAATIGLTAAALGADSKFNSDIERIGLGVPEYTKTYNLPKPAKKTSFKKSDEVEKHMIGASSSEEPWWSQGWFTRERWYGTHPK